MKKVLIIRTGAIGDVVETTGLIRALKKADYKIDYLTGKVPAELLKYDNDINKLYTLESKKYSYIFKLSKILRKEKYNIILNLQPSIRFKILSFLTHAKKVSTYKKSYKFHAVENFFETGKMIIPELTLDKNIHIDIPEDIKNKMKQNLSENKIKICFNTGANNSRQGRKWCIDYWEQLANLIFDRYEAEIFLIGGKEDIKNTNNLISKNKKIKSFAGKTSLIETAALLSFADLVISGDTGPLHIASAAGTTCLGLYGCCSIRRSGPYGENNLTISSDYHCAPCDAKKCKFLKDDIDDTPCMREITPEKVLNLVDTILIKK